MEVRGEYKVPGGKLVAVDLEARAGRLGSVRLSGDFFLEPDSALETIDAILTGMPLEASVQEISAAIDAGLGAATTMYGVDSRSIGIAVHRALGRATRWEDHTFDLIAPVVLDPLMHMALDEVLPAEVAAGRRGPLLRFWDWDSPVVIIGSYQSLRNEVELAAAAQAGVRIARRISGGGAMFMEPGNSITYSLVVPGSLVDGLSFEQSYAHLDEWVISALETLGVHARYVPLNDIATDSGKIGGAAQRRFASGVVLHHVTMAYDIDAEKMARVLRIGREKLSDKGIASARKRVDPIRSQTQMARADVIAALLEYFREHRQTRPSAYTDDELARAKDLIEGKFTRAEWTERVP